MIIFGVNPVLESVLVCEDVNGFLSPVPIGVSLSVGP